MSPKDRVRANIYKELLNEEKKKNKRMQRATLSIFFVGIVGLSSYESFIRERIIEEKAPAHVIVFDEKELLENTEIEKINIDHFFTKEIFTEKKIEINSESVFGFDFQS